MRFIHTADLQIGARFSQFGEKADALRAARVTVLSRILDLAESESADAVLIAGDMFEDNQVADRLVRDVISVLNAHTSVPVVILPGNHDPVSGPGCLWMRPPFDNPPDHVTVCTSTSPVEMGDAVILPSPITQKRSTRDPAYPLVALARAVAPGKIKIGMTHGSFAIESKHQPDDHPIALNAATRAGLDYLAVGHWHSLMEMDAGRLVMPGTPEPDQFGQAAAGVVIVDVDGPGASPAVKQIPCATFAWHECSVDVAADGDVEDLVASALAGVDGDPESVVLRMSLHGATDPERRRAFEAAAADLSATYAVAQVQNDTVIRLSDAIWRAWQQEHPLLAQVVADVEQARLFTAGTPPAVAAEGLAALTLPELRGVCSRIGIAEGDLNADVLETAHELLIGEMSAVVAGESAS